MPDTSNQLLFPADFRWGTATSSHQVEGYQTNNDWWAAEQKGGYIYKNQTAGAACNWWQNAEADFDRMANMGQNAHRLSLEWSRIQPTPNSWDEAAIARYRQMIQGMLDRGIDPLVTINHFTLPLWVAQRGGWENEAIAEWFESYSSFVVSQLSDLVDFWCTINEPMVLIAQGYLTGYWPPGRINFRKAVQVAHNMVRAHAEAYHAIHAIQPKARVGLAKHMVVWRPHRFWLPTDQLFSRMVNNISNHVILDALTDGVIRLPIFRDIHVERAAGTLDWLGVNYYQRFRVGLKLWDGLRNLIPGIEADLLHFGTKPGLQKGPGEWGEIHPEGLLESLQSVEQYGVPLYITENGIPDEHDRYRPAFILSHLHQLWQAQHMGMDVRGYYHWSLVDNFEWSEGYDPRFRFGLYGVDFETQERTLKESGRLYAKICQLGGLDVTMVDEFAPRLHSVIFPAP